MTNIQSCRWPSGLRWSATLEQSPYTSLRRDLFWAVGLLCNLIIRHRRPSYAAQQLAGHYQLATSRRIFVAKQDRRTVFDVATQDRGAKQEYGFFDRRGWEIDPGVETAIRCTQVLRNFSTARRVGQLSQHRGDAC